jgi:hypothetical protein
MPTTPTPLSPVQQAEQALQVAGVLDRMERRITSGAWARGTRFDRDGGNCLIGAIDEATRWSMPGVAETVTHELASRLPAPFRGIARLRPRMALALYNDSIGGQRGAAALVRAAREDLGLARPASTPVSTTIWVDGDQVPTTP